MTLLPISPLFLQVNDERTRHAVRPYCSVEILPGFNMHHVAGQMSENLLSKEPEACFQRSEKFVVLLFRLQFHGLAGDWTRSLVTVLHMADISHAATVFRPSKR